MPDTEATVEGISEPTPLVARLLPGSERRQVTGARLGNKRFEVERMLLEGDSKLRIARALKISAHSVRAVARQMGEEGVSSPLREDSKGGNGEPSRKDLPDTLRNKAIQAVDAITPAKLGKASPQACAIVADRLLGRADALETRGSNLGFLGNLMQQYGIEPSHSASRVTLEQKITVETQHTTQTDT